MEAGETSETINYPEWTEYQKKNGLDPLGMQNSSVNLYQTFLPGISNVTLRMRYYGLYAWLSRSYAKKSAIPIRRRGNDISGARKLCMR